jgi:hypothetical protein
MAVRNVYVAGGNGIGYTYEVDSPSDYVSISNNTYFKDLSLGVGGLILYKSSTGEIIEIYASQIFKTVNGITILGTGNVSTYSNTGNILYVATTGSDTFPDTTRISRLGSINVPFLTLEAAKAVAVSGDLIHVFAGDYTPVSNIAKDGIKYYFEPNAKVTMTVAASIFDTTGFTVGFDVLGYGEFTKTTNVGYILLGGSGMSGYQAVFEAQKVLSTISNCLHCTVGVNIYFKIPYLKSTGGNCLAHTTNSSIKIDAASWTTTAGRVITNVYGVINYSNLTVNADYFQSTSNDAIEGGYAVDCNLNLNINELIGVTYGLNMYGAYDPVVVNLNCSYTNGIKCWSTIRFSGHCRSLVIEWNGIGRHAFIGGSCQYINSSAGYVETTLGGSSDTSSGLTVSGGFVKISKVIGNLNALSMSITGGETHIYRINQSSSGSLREVNGGTLYLYDVDLNSTLGVTAFVPVVKLTSGNLYLRGRIVLINTEGNPGEPSNPTTLTQTSKSNVVLWTGGNLILDGCTLITQHQNDLPIVSRTANQVLRINSKGCTTNRPELGGLLAAKQEKILITVANVTYATITQTISSGAASSNFSITTAGKTTTQAATALCNAINADSIPVTATDNGNGSYYLEADVAGDPFTYSLYNSPYNGDISLQGNIIRDNSYSMLNPMGGQIIESSYVQ